MVDRRFTLFLSTFSPFESFLRSERAERARSRAGQDARGPPRTRLAKPF